MLCYLIHLDRPLHHARHYLGSTQDLSERLARHRTGRGARLLQVCNELGIGYQVVRTWDGGRPEEIKLKAQKNAPRLCPLCHPHAHHYAAHF